MSWFYLQPYTYIRYRKHEKAELRGKSLNALGNLETAAAAIGAGRTKKIHWNERLQAAYRNRISLEMWIASEFTISFPPSSEETPSGSMLVAFSFPVSP